MPTNPFTEERERRKTNPFTAERERRSSEFQLARQPGPLESYLRTSGSRLADNALSFPDAVVTAGLRTMAGQPLVDRPMDPRELQRRFPGITPEQIERMNSSVVSLPEMGDRVLPVPRMEDISAAARTVPKLPGVVSGEETLPDAFDRSRNEAIMSDATMRAQNPGATMAGDITGDIATLLTGRAGFRAGGKAMGPAATIPASRAPTVYIPPGLRRELDDITRSVLASKLPRGVGRAAETGVEGAVLATLQQGDPMQAAALSAGGQALGSFSLWMASPLASRKTLFPSIAMAALGLQWFNTAVRDGNDHFLNSTETAMNKVIPTMALGLLAGTAFSRVGGRLKENLPLVADTITGIPRGAFVSMVQDLSNDREKGDVRAVLERYAADPAFYGPGAMVRIKRALDNGNLGKEVERMMQNPEFRSAVYD